MGSLLSVFRSKSDTKALLERIQNEIESIEDFKDSASRREKNCFCLLFTAFIIIYLMSALIVFLFVIIPTNLVQKVLCFSPFIISPLIFLLFKRFLQSYYRWIADNKDQRLKELKKQKKKILEKVKETENFKDAKDILEKYDPKALFESVSFRTLNACSTPLFNNTPQRLTAQTNTQLRYRSVATPMRPMPAIMASPSFGTNSTTGFRPTQVPMSASSFRGPVMTPQRPPMMPMAPALRSVKPILAQNRTVMEKLVDYVVGDGPNNRYALICIHCYSHNGMALKEEFEFIAFLCCYCKRFNPSRKARPSAPRLQSLDPSQRSSLTPVVDEPESDTDSEKGRISAEDSTRIQEITSHLETDNQSEGNDKNRVEFQTEESSEERPTESVETASPSSQSDPSNESTANGSDKHEDPDEDDVNRDTEELNEIPFMDESGL